MKSKKLLNLFAIIIGVLMCFAFNQVHAEDSNFGATNITRENLKSIVDANALTENNSVILGIYAQRSAVNGNNAYQWNPPADLIEGGDRYQETLNAGYFPDSTNTAWKIAKYPSLSSDREQSDYSKLYYCLNAEKGFGLSNGQMANGNKATYNIGYDMKTNDSTERGNITRSAEGNLGTNYNQILWILDNIYIPGKSTDTEKSELFKKSFKYITDHTNLFDKLSVIVPNSIVRNVVSTDMIDSETSHNLTDDDIEVAQQMAIWYFTNEGNQYYHLDTGTLPPMYLNGSQLRTQGNGIDGYPRVTSGAIREWKMNALFMYLINNASSTYTPTTPSLNLTATNNVEESGNYFVAGPFSLSKTTNVNIESLTVKLGNNTLSSSDYLIVSSKTSTTNVTDYDNLSDFYVKVKKEKVTSSTTIKVSVTGKSQTRKLTFLTDERETNQPVVLIEVEPVTITKEAEVNINLGKLKIIKTTSEGQTTPNETEFTITGPNGYSTTVKYKNFNHKSERYHLIENLPLGRYTVTENTGTAQIENYTLEVTGDNGASKAVTRDATAEFSITNTYTHDVGKLRIRKISEGATPPATLEFEIRGVNNNYYKKVYYSQFENGIYEESGLEVGTYTVTENTGTAQIENYTLEVTGDNGASKAITKNATVEFSITNIYSSQIIDLALRKYITKIGNTEITNRIPQISDTDKLDGDDAANHTAIYAHPKNVLEVQKGNMIEYSITIYNEGKVPARATQITDQLPAGLKFIEVVSGNYEVKDYYTGSNKLVLKETSANTDLGAFEKGHQLNSTTVVVKCKVLDTAEEEVNLVNVAWISAMKKENVTFEEDIDSATTQDRSPACDQNSHSYSRDELGNTGYFPGQEDDDDFERVIVKSRPSLNIKLIKVDESESTITSSEAKFDIKEGNGNVENKTTQSGILDLGTKSITGTSFEYIYTIKETQAPTGYQLVGDELSIKVSGTVKLENNRYVIDTIELKDKDGNDLDTSKIKAEYDNTSNTVIIKVKDRKIENEYSLRILKVNQDGTQALEGAKFKISTSSDMTGVEEQTILIGGNDIASGRLSSTDSIELTYYLQETLAPEGYIKDEEVKEVKIKADVELRDGQYILKNVSLDPAVAVNGIELVTENNVITIKVKNNPEIISGKYKVIVKKVDSTTGEEIPADKGAKFKINNTEYTLGQQKIAEEEITSADDINLSYTIEETQAPTGYERIEGTKTARGTLKINKVGTTWKVNRLENVQVDDNIEMVQDSTYKNTIIIKIKDNPIEKDFDLALRKFITAVNDVELKNGDVYTRAPIVDTTPLKNKTATTAIYKHTKFPVSVQKGDIVTYTIRVYNEGEVDGYVNKIADYLPNYLQPIFDGNSEIDITKYTAEATFNRQRLWALGENGRVETEITNKEKQSAIDMYGEDGLLLSKFAGGDELDYIDVQIKCLVKNDTQLATGTYLTNIAEIVDAEDINGVHGDGSDSALNGLKNGNPTDTSDLFNYKNTEALASNTNSYIEGQEDDDDFEKLVIESFDLALRKFAIAIKSGDNEVELKDENGKYTRAPVVDASKLGTVDESGNQITTAIYTHSKTPLEVKKGDIITYVLRVYNEGTLDGYANKIIDYIPEGLEFVKDSSVNIANEWKMLDKDGNETTDVSQAVKIVTDHRSQEKALPIDGGRTEDSNIILAFNKERMNEPDSIDVQVQFKVTADPKECMGQELVNYAEIGEESNIDIDSTPGDGHGDKASKEDDDDFEPIKLGYFDLALRKFITKVNTIDYNNRAPEVDTSKYGTTDENGKKITTFTYNHTKDPVIVEPESTVTYTIRVYNEGTIAGYAYEITDNIPEGLQFLPDNETNKEYKWKMLDEQGNETTDVTKAKKITTAYLANQIIDAYKKEDGIEVLSYKDVKVAFKVIEPGTSDRLVINTAEISKASDEDIDSTPGNDDLTEDDIDREYLKVKYFDLALKKWVYATKVIYDGKTKTTKTGFDEDSTEIAKVDLVAKKLKKTTVKFVYKIKVINEGEVAGYATEVEDYIPKGLKFVQADNPKWKLTKGNIAVTDQLKDVLLEPGQTATVEIVLTWKNSASNLGLKTNWAEIKADSGDDIDSTPDNDKRGEDDEDSAQVILSIKTGSVQTYILLIFTSVTILGGGAFLIKKYVIK